jgi:hypothetical protein
MVRAGAEGPGPALRLAHSESPRPLGARPHHTASAQQGPSPSYAPMRNVHDASSKQDVGAHGRGRWHDALLAENGQLGDGTTTNRLTPVRVSGLSGMVAVAAGESFSLAVRNDGTVWGWGSNGQGQLGESIPPYSTSPIRCSLP